jgi:acyl-CoA synthetase (AMP-forming)/AMP-acid ligase II
MGMGGVYHTLNPRLFPEQIAWIMNHAEDKMIFVDLTFMPVVEKIAPAGEVAEEGDRADRQGAHAANRAAQCRGL